MACAPIELAPENLAVAIDRAHCWAEHTIAAPGRAALDSVWWLSTHLTTVERVLHPTARRALQGANAIVDEQRRRAHAIIHQLWGVEHALSGDGRMRALTAADLTALAEQVRDYAAAENRLVEMLEHLLSTEELDRLHRRYAKGVRRAPTRPHPMLAHSRALAAAAFRVEGVVDRARDVLDGRSRPRRLAG
jgi:hypothetical protein